MVYHSAGGMAGSGGAGLCNPSDWFCNGLTLGTAANDGGSAKWANHSVKFRDDSESFNGGFNSEVQVFGALIRDKVPGFPLQLRDVDGFLLNADTFRDRAMTARQPGVIYTSARCNRYRFSTSERTSEDRERYLTE